MKPNGLTLLSTAVASLGGLLFGFDTAVIAGATHGMAVAFGLTPMTLGFTVSCALWGTVAGGFLASPLGSRYGSRLGLRVTALLYLVSAAGCALAWNWFSLLAFRFIGGLGIGASSVLSPMYIAEISPSRWRGRLVACFQLSIVLGILVAYASNFWISTFHLGSVEWRYELGAAVVPTILFLSALVVIPDSPRWLLVKGRIQEAREIFRRIGQTDDAIEALSLAQGASHPQEVLFTRKHRRVILIALSVGILNQLSGINAILYYLNDIFVQAGLSATSASRQAILIGGANLIFTILAMSLIDKIGRRFMLLAGSLGMGFCLLIIAAALAGKARPSSLVWALIAYIAFFCFSQGTVIWVYLSEIFPPGIREKGQSFGTLALWLTNGAIALVFPKVASISGQYPFILFAIMMFLQFVLALKFFPETKGISIEEASARLV